MRLLVHNALLIPVADAARDWFPGWLLVDDDGRIAAIEAGEPDPALLAGGVEVLDAGGAIVAPGFVSAHSHLFTSGMRGISAGSTLYPWVLSMVEVMDKCSPDDVYWSVLHGSLDFLANGVTSAYNFTHSRVTWRYNPETASPELGRVAPVEFVTRQFDGAADAGLRVVNAIRLDDEAGPEDEMLGVFGDMVAESALRTPADQHLGASVMGAVQWASAPRSAELEVEVMRRHGITNQAHFVETAQGIETQREKFAWYRDAGAFGPDFLFGHFVHPTDEMVDVAASTGCGVVWQATSNGRLGSGFMDAVRLRDAGLRIGLGLDDQSCTDISDPWGNMRMGLYTTRALNTDASVLMPADVLRMHTLAAAEVLGVADRIGSLEVGKYADFVVVDHRSPDTGPVWDVLATYVLACGLRNLKQVYSGGVLVHDGGRSTSPLAMQAPGELRARITEAAARWGVTLPLAAWEAGE
ncbi:amidohydrolase family protein [Cellulomonas sp. JH27-2]|uniref:amidohydrolase family protein n=1 Tax=Cellulomonas sp. JH27-2 TaxID=2774139 RepID=UPI00177FD15C|nr:amidohydrolase family protein [Cellulomonas sp. JH27-2]MBD8060005.1 amidohydrolase family protein [Cellulomonas sp. JH27-2]